SSPHTGAASLSARARASLLPTEPSSVAGILASEPPNLPTAVRTAETMTMSSMEGTPRGSGDSGEMGLGEKVSMVSGLGFVVAAGRWFDRLVLACLAVAL